MVVDIVKLSFFFFFFFFFFFIQINEREQMTKCYAHSQYRIQESPKPALIYARTAEVVRKSERRKQMNSCHVLAVLYNATCSWGGQVDQMMM